MRVSEIEHALLNGAAEYGRSGLMITLNGNQRLSNAGVPNLLQVPGWESVMDRVDALDQACQDS